MMQLACGCWEMKFSKEERKRLRMEYPNWAMNPKIHNIKDCLKRQEKDKANNKNG